jgi:hypothetical protein
MQNFYLIDYLKSNKKLSPELLDSLKAELDRHIYYYGNHFKYPKERPHKNNIIASVKRHLSMTLHLIKSPKADQDKKTILSNAYFTTNSELRKLNYNVYSPCWWMASDGVVLSTLNIYLKSEEIKRKFELGSFLELTSQVFAKQVDDFCNDLSKFYTQKKISALIVPNDVSFFENLSIQLCKKNKIPSFIFLHGLPGRYNIIDENRSDYLIVWGEKIKENYVKTGFDPAKIFISGHPYYKTIPVQKLRFSLENILVLTKSMNGGQHSEEVILGDRGNSILYLLKIQETLMSLGVKRIRYRPHPCENPSWYQRFLDPDFFVLDTLTLEQSLIQSTLVIGPTSTVMVESLYHGANYLIFEPNVNGIDLFNYPLVAPFDGKDNKVPLAQTESDLIYLINSRIPIDISFLKDYIQTPFNLDFIKKLI